jgi:hypothetical protein
MVGIILSENIARGRFFVHGDERPSPIKDRTFIGKLIKYKLLKKFSAHWISLGQDYGVLRRGGL